ncbi:dihydrolipoyllysine-residue acetyltransferase component of pyruvate dehydrogenase complex, mitochondrial-like [Amphibalanus amphitrite]|uniref:dihydrolipoyllysine-residue acetyltransferase component of pyruvate dehydrogenase complex, mitochondrial-like n=1 Tax=Amphibalanus amphitrite TaxID=1232801 RepID=UPI001C8FFD6D|nr:dihydrolipoyllysine-residue acetyltransferase component of pyruvate dehydrogenase complex, mitochondrial-like [Amphibalanus amphitrite]XP_043223986.1 dihydrolipoyllysine-residue acetyltransferase component of pyruvate dehydrogenase complex, mitochondrial-like [Amphibalanus amphitrite]
MLLRPAVPLSRALGRHARLGQRLARPGAALLHTPRPSGAPRARLLGAPAAARPVGWARHYASQDLPAHHKIVLPALSPTMESGSIISWEKAEGDFVGEGDLLAEIETDKASMGFENSEEGYLAKILVPAGTKDIPLGKLLCIIVDSKEDVDKFKDYVDTSEPAPPAAAPAAEAPKPAAPAATPAPAAAPVAPAAPAAAPAGPPGGRIMASPRARKLAAEQGVDLTAVSPGSDGLIRAAQVTAAPAPAPSAAAAPAAAAPAVQPSAAHVDVELSSVRKTIASRLLQSKQTIPHYYLSVDVDMSAVAQIRAETNQRAGKDGVKLSVNDFIIKAAALACLQVPEVNSSWQETFIRQYSSVDVSVAVSTDYGLITPIVFGAERRGVADISSEVRRLAERARARQLQPNEFQGGTFSISNLGMFGVKNFSAIINPPQSCILAVGGAVQKLLPGPDGPRTADVLSVTLSCDHRVVDGAVGAQWLAAFRRYMEQPVTMIL